MKKLVLTNIQSGVRKLGAVKATLEHIQESYVETIANLFTAFLAGTSLPVSVHGCVNSGSGSTYNISAGAIYHNGEMFEIDTFAGTAGGGQVPVLSLVSTWRAGDPVKYSDGSNHNTHTIRKYQWSFGASGSGLGDFGQVVTLKSRINDHYLDVDGQVSAAVAALIGTAPGALDTLGEIADALNDDANLYTTLTNLINGKVAKTGDSMSGNLTIPDGTAGGHAVNKNQLDGKVAKGGDTMSGNLTIPDGTTSGHAVNKGQLDSEASARSGADTTLQNQITALNTDSGWVTISSFSTGISGTGVQYRKFGNRVYLRGVITITYASWVVAQGWFTLPSGFRPAVETTYGNTQSNDSSIPGIAVNTVVKTTGNVSGGTVGGAAYTTAQVWLGGISFFVD